MDKISLILGAIKKHLLRWLNRYVSLFVFIALLWGLYLFYYTDILKETSDQISYFGFVLTSFSILLVMLQFRSTQSWNKRQLAIVAINEIKEKGAANVYILNKAFGFLQLSSHETIAMDLIHEKVCKKKGDGTIYRDGEGKMKIEDEEEGEGYAVRKAITARLSDFEYLAAGINQDVFDEEIMLALYRGVFIKTYNNFKDYIEHYNKVMFPERNNSVWKNFKLLAEELIEEEKVTLKSDKRKGVA